MHLVDPTAGPRTSQPAATTINRELELHGGGLADRPQIVVLSKFDQIPADERAALLEALGRGPRVLGGHRRGMPELVAELFRIVPELAPTEPVPSSSRSSPTSSSTAPARRCDRATGSCATAASCASRAVRSSASALDLDPEDEGSVARLAAEFERMGLDEALREAGAKRGEDILIGQHRLVYQPSRAR